MKQLRIIDILAIVMVFLLMTAVSCSNKKTSSGEYYGAVEKVTASATQLVVKEFTHPSRQVTLEKNSPEFNVILGYLENTEVTMQQPRFVVQEGKKLEVRIPYALNYILVFTLSDGSEITFDYGTKIWFNTKDMIYGASINAALFELLKQMVGN